MIAFSCQDIRKSETVKMNTFQKNKSMQIERSKSTCRFENHLTKDQQKHTNFICQKIIKKFRLISKLNLGWLVNLIYVNFWPKFQSVNQQIYVNFDISKITNLRDSRFGLVSRWCLAVSHGLPRGWFLVWRCVLHGRVSSFFRASESSVRQFFCGAVLAGLGSCLGGVWLFRMGCRGVGFWFGGAFCTVELHLSLGHQKAAFGSFFAVRFWLVWARV